MPQNRGFIEKFEHYVARFYDNSRKPRNFELILKIRKNFLKLFCLGKIKTKKLFDKILGNRYQIMRTWDRKNLKNIKFVIIRK